MSAIRNFDVGLVIAVVLLTAIYSATYVGEKQTEFTKQLLWAVLGLVVLTAVVVTPLKSYYKNAYLLYGLSVILLVVVLFVGKGAGTRRWIALGPAWIQPA